MSRLRRRRPVLTQRRERHWIQSTFLGTPHPTGETAAFQLLASMDYTEGDNPLLQGHCTVLRSVGRFEFDIIPNPELGGATMTYFAALGVAGENQLQDAALVDPMLPEYNPADPLMPRLLDRYLQGFGGHSFVQALFHDTFNTNAITSVVYTGDEQRFGIDWDVTQKVKMANDQTLWLFVFGETIGSLGEGLDWASIGWSRTLFAD